MGQTHSEIQLRNHDERQRRAAAAHRGTGKECVVPLPARVQQPRPVSARPTRKLPRADCDDPPIVAAACRPRIREVLPHGARLPPLCRTVGAREGRARWARAVHQPGQHPFNLTGTLQERVRIRSDACLLGSAERCPHCARQMSSSPAEMAHPVREACMVHFDLRVSSLRRGHANLLCIVPNSTDDPRRDSMVTCKMCLHESKVVRFVHGTVEVSVEARETKNFRCKLPDKFSHQWMSQGSSSRVKRCAARRLSVPRGLTVSQQQ